MFSFTFYANFHASVTLLDLFGFSCNFHQNVELSNWKWHAPFWEVFAHSLIGKAPNQANVHTKCKISSLNG